MYCFQVELKIQPDKRSPLAISPPALSILAKMDKLERLSVPFAMSDFASNMPQLFYILCMGYKRLKHMNISWSQNGNRGAHLNNCIMYKMMWLKDTLNAEGRNVDINLDYDLHPTIYEAHQVSLMNWNVFVWA